MLAKNKFKVFSLFPFVWNSDFVVEKYVIKQMEINARCTTKESLSSILCDKMAVFRILQWLPSWKGIGVVW